MKARLGSKIRRRLGLIFRALAVLGASAGAASACDFTTASFVKPEPYSARATEALRIFLKLDPACENADIKLEEIGGQGLERLGGGALPLIRESGRRAPDERLVFSIPPHKFAPAGAYERSFTAFVNGAQQPRNLRLEVTAMSAARFRSSEGVIDFGVMATGKEGSVQFLYDSTDAATVSVRQTDGQDFMMRARHGLTPIPYSLRLNGAAIPKEGGDVSLPGGEAALGTLIAKLGDVTGSYAGVYRDSLRISFTGN